MSLFAKNSEEIIDSKIYDSEVGKPYVESIVNNPKNAIVTGPRCSGKTIVLKEVERRQIKTGNDAIYIPIDQTNLAMRKDLKESKYNFELFLSDYILNYCQKNYKRIYNRDLSNVHHEIIVKRDDYYESTNGFGTIKIEDYNGEKLFEIISLVKKVLDIDKLTIMLDRYDWVSNPQEFQEMTKYYLNIFDKYVITTDDQKVLNKDRMNDLENKNYNIVNVDHGRIINYVKEIITRDLKYWSKPQNRKFGKQYLDIRDLIDVATYNELIMNCRGNFGLLYDTLREFYITESTQEEILVIFKEVLERRQIEESIHVKKLYL